MNSMRSLLLMVPAVLFLTVGCGTDKVEEKEDPPKRGLSEYFVVDYPEDREILINGRPSGYRTGELVELRKGTYEISLEGGGFTPQTHTLQLSDSHPMEPMRLTFGAE